MIEIPDVAAGIMTRWTAIATATPHTVPLWYGRVDESATAPYVRLTVSQTAHRRHSTGYMRDFVATFSIWGDGGPVALDTVLGYIASVMDRANLSITGATRTVDTKPTTGEVTVEPTTRNANDVCLAQSPWLVRVQG